VCLVHATYDSLTEREQFLATWQNGSILMHACATKMVKLAYFKKLIKQKIRSTLTAQLTKAKSEISESQKEFLESLDQDQA
jgi:uncharacterized protein YbcI